MDPATILTILGAIGAAIGTAIAAMWRKVSSDNDKVAERCERLEAKDDARDKEMSEMQRMLAVFQACPSQPCGAREAMNRAGATFNLRPKSK